MGAGYFSSKWKGSQIDNAIGVVVDSGVSASNMSVLKNATAGMAVASKALVADAEISLRGLNVLGANRFLGNVLNMVDIADPTVRPVNGTKYLYVKGDYMYMMDSAGNVKRYGGGREVQFEFSGVTSIACEHNLSNLYPIVDVYGTNGKPIECQIDYQNGNRLVVSFNHTQTGVVIVRTV